MLTTLKRNGLFLLSLLFVVSGCAVPGDQTSGSLFSAPTIAVTPGQVQEGTWQNEDIEISYACEREGSTLTIKGQATLSQHYTMLYAMIDQFQVSVVFVDENTRVLGRHLLGSDLTGAVDAKLPFAETLTPPAGTTSISFDYLVDPHEESG